MNDGRVTQEDYRAVKKTRGHEMISQIRHKVKMQHTAQRVGVCCRPWVRKHRAVHAQTLCMEDLQRQTRNRESGGGVGLAEP